MYNFIIQSIHIIDRWYKNKDIFYILPEKKVFDNTNAIKNDSEYK